MSFVIGWLIEEHFIDRQGLYFWRLGEVHRLLVSIVRIGQAGEACGFPGRRIVGALKAGQGFFFGVIAAWYLMGIFTQVAFCLGLR